MKHISIEFFPNNLVSPALCTTELQKLIPIMSTISNRNNEALYSFATLPDKQYLDHIRNVAEQKKQLQPAAIIIIGIGGANLGTMAVQQALLGQLYNETTNNITIYYADSVDYHYIRSLLAISESYLKDGRPVLLNVVSKSGTTTETIANFELFLTLIQRYRPMSYQNEIVVTTDKDSTLWNRAEAASWQLLEIPRSVGGRYSVFSAVSLFPLAMMNIDIIELLRGAEHATHNCLEPNFNNNAAMSAIWHYTFYKKSYFINNCFLFSNGLLALGNWWKQLIAESLGKPHKKDGSPNNNGIVPIVSVGTTDLHAIGQLFFADIAKIVTTFVSYAQEQEVHQKKNDLAFIMNSIFNAVIKSYQTKEMPYRTIIIPENSPFYIGALLKQYMFETVYLAELLKVNPFDQPSVESYKQETRKILANE